MDICFDTESGILNYRVAAIIKKDNKYLVTENPKGDYLSLIGGRVKIGESSIEAITREIKEETSYEISEARVRGIVENFFELQNKTFHEILVLIKVDFQDQSIYDKEKVKCLDKENTYFTWKSLDELKKENLKPTCIIDLLDKNELFHIINHD